MKILLVDDDKELLEQSKMYLEKEKEEFDVESAFSAKNALKKLEKMDYDVIVTDYQMPKMDGLEFLEILRKERDVNIPIIIFTGKGREEVAMKALNLGADRYIQKGGKPRSQYAVLIDAIEQEYDLYRKGKELKRSEKEKSLILENADEIIAYHDTDHNIRWANKAYREATGLSSDDLKDKKCYHAWGLEDECEGCPVTEAIVDGEPHKAELTPESQKDWPEDQGSWLVKASPIKDEYERIIGAVEIAVDISQSKQRERELKRKEEYIKHSPDIMILLDEEGKVEYQSPTGEDILGYKPLDLIGEKPLKYIHPDDKEDALKKFEEILENPQGLNRCRLRLKTPDEEWRWYEVRSYNLLDDPKVDGILLNVRDITEQKENEKELEEEKKRRMTLLDHLPGIALILKKESREIVFSNKPAKDVGAVPGKTCYGTVAERDDPCPFCRAPDLWETGEKQEIEVEYRGTHYRGIWFPYTDDLYVHYIFDITERKQAQEREELLHSILRHDVANKNRIAQGYLQLLEDYDLTEESKMLLEKSENALAKSLKLIEKVRILREAQEEEVSEEDVTSQINIALEEVKPLAEEAEMKIDMKKECPKEGCIVKAGPLIKNVFSNIIENSIRHSHGSKLKILVKTTDKGVLCRFEDDGKGIPEKDRDNIFEKGFTTDKERGTGLGLFLVYMLLKIYDGEIEVKESELGGARFDIHLKR